MEALHISKDFFDQPNYKLAKILGDITGMWPYPSRRKSICFPLVVMAFIFQFTCQVRQLLGWMKEDYNLVNTDEEKILNKYANHGRILAALYTGTVYAGVISFNIEPRLDAILEGFLNPNYTKPEEELLYPTPMAFGGLNLDGYHYIVQAISYVCVLVIMTIILCNDALFIVYMQHICGRFEGLGFSDSVKTLNEWSFLYVVGCNMMMLSISAVQAVTQMNSIQSFVKFALFTSSQILHLFFECFMSQLLINHSSYIRTCLHEAAWYENTPKTQKMMVFMLLRSQVPCRLTAGKVVELSMETFSSMMKTSVSYFTVFLSMQ